MRTGRPPKTPADRRTSDIKIPLTDTEKELIFEAAQVEGNRPVTWSRELLVEAANRIVNRTTRNGEVE